MIGGNDDGEDVVQSTIAMWVVRGTKIGHIVQAKFPECKDANQLTVSLVRLLSSHSSASTSVLRILGSVRAKDIEL